MFETPLAAILALIDARNRGDIDAAARCYEPQATIVAQPGTVLHGSNGVRQALNGFVALQPEFRVLARTIMLGDKVALHISRWSLRGTAPDGAQLNLTGGSADVIRQQTDGGWLIAIDDPWGADLRPDPDLT